MEGAPSTSHPAHTDAEPSLDELYRALGEYLILEHKFQPKLCLPDDSESESGEVTIGARDGAAHVLRCLKVWFDLPADILIDAVNLLDRFLTKMKVRPCHVPCITVSCMNIAIELYHHQKQTPRAVCLEELVSISQSACTAGDVSRMSHVISDKLGVQRAMPVLSAARWLRLLRALLAAAASHLQLTVRLAESELMNLLEIAVCDAGCGSARPSELALVLLYYKLEQELVGSVSEAAGGAGAAAGGAGAGALDEQAYALFHFGAQLQQHCRMSDASLAATGARARSVLARYEAREAAPHRQRLVWRLSSRTLKVLRPTDRLTSLLPTIEEQHLAPDPSHSPHRHRSGSESSESEDTADWPRSPVLPVYCHN